MQLKIKNCNNIENGEFDITEILNAFAEERNYEKRKKEKAQK